MDCYGHQLVCVRRVAVSLRQRRVLQMDKVGNDGADKLACLGADAHPVRDSIVKETKQRRQAAVETQSMMLAILEARRVTLAAMAGGDLSHLNDVEVPEHEIVDIWEGEAVLAHPWPD